MASPSAYFTRRLEAADIHLMRKLNALFGRAFADPATFGDAPPSDAYLERLLSREHVAYGLDKFEQERREYYIYDLAVDERHRREGVATALIDHLRGIAAQCAAWVIYVQADYGDEPAIALYTKLGLREDVMHFDIAVAAHGTRS